MHGWPDRWKTGGGVVQRPIHPGRRGRRPVRGRRRQVQACAGGSASIGTLSGGHRDSQLVGPKRAERVGQPSLVNGNYFCQSPRRRSAGRRGGRDVCDTARFLVEDGLVTDAQVRRLREKRMAGKTLAAAAAAAGMSERAARKWQSGPLPSTAKAPRWWWTREDPFAEVWQSEVVPQLVADTDGRLQVLTLFKALCRRHPGRFQPGQLRTLQRRVREWRVQYGPGREVYFEQVPVPGREAAFDFTDLSELGVTLRRVAFPHLLFEWVLSYSRWTYVELALSETFEALVSGLQGALWTLGAVPTVLRHDNLSAATHELRRNGGRQLTARFRQVLDHYGLLSSRIQPGKPHENGVAEQSHFRTATAIEQALLLRGGRDFVDEAAYMRFVGCPGGGSVGRGASVSAVVAGSSGPGVHDVPVPGAEVEHDPGRWPGLLGAVAVDRSLGRGSPVSVDGGGPLRRAGAVHDAAAAGRG